MSILYFFASIFGYALNFLYDFVGNYGIAIIIFSVIVKLITIPLSIKQQKTMKKSAKIQDEMKQIQFKYKNDPEKVNQEVMALYKRENMSPFSGCLSSIVQLVLLLSVFILVSSPLTYMVKMDTDVINKLDSIVSQNDNNKKRYKEIAIIQYIKNYESNYSVEETNQKEKKEDKKQEQEEQKQDDFKIEDYKDQVNLNMDLLGIDLSAVPTQDLSNWKALVIPVLYVITSFISIKLTTITQNKKKTKVEEDENIENGEEDKKEEVNPMADASKSMTWFMPLMSVSIAIIAPLGLALYWLMNNLLSIIERLILNKVLKEEEETENV